MLPIVLLSFRLPVLHYGVSPSLRHVLLASSCHSRGSTLPSLRPALQSQSFPSGSCHLEGNHPHLSSVRSIDILASHLLFVGVCRFLLRCHRFAFSRVSSPQFFSALCALLSFHPLPWLRTLLARSVVCGAWWRGNSTSGSASKS